MISHSHKFIFIHVPKTGGTAIEAYLGQYGETVLDGYVTESIYFKHATAADLRVKLGAPIYERYFRFAFVRNPWDWVASNYASGRGGHLPYLLRAQTSLDQIGAIKRAMSFGDWLEKWVAYCRPSQCLMLCDGARLVPIDFIGRYERLSADLRTACDRIGIPAPDPLPVVNRTEGRRPNRDIYTRRDFDFVADAFAEDIRMFGYSDVTWSRMLEAA